MNVSENAKDKPDKTLTDNQYNRENEGTILFPN